MDMYSKEELGAALKVVSSTIVNCEKMQPKFAEGTSQHTLLKNRLKALYISKALIEGEDIANIYTREELIEAVTPISSIISKSEKGILRFEEGHGSYTRFKRIIDAIHIARSLINSMLDEI